MCIRDRYQRGISSSNTQLCSLNKAGGLAKHEINFELLKQFVTKQTFISLDEAVRNKPRNMSTALSPRMAYVPDMNMLFVDFVAIALLDKKDKTITMIKPIFHDEVIHLTRNSQYKVI